MASEYLVKLEYYDGQAGPDYTYQLRADSVGEAMLRASNKSPCILPSGAEVLVRTGPATKPEWLKCWFDRQVLAIL